MPANSRSNGSGNWNEHNLNPLARNHWRASLVPAAAVTPAPIAYIKVVAVKTLVVGFRDVVGQAPGRLRVGRAVKQLGGRDCPGGSSVLPSLGRHRPPRPSRRAPRAPARSTVSSPGPPRTRACARLRHHLPAGACAGLVGWPVYLE
jgi:hypothetical protein